MLGFLPLCGVGLWLGGWIANDAYHDSSLGDPLAFLGTALFLVGLAIPWIAYLRHYLPDDYRPDDRGCGWPKSCRSPFLR